jgi:hypothetical protein
MYNLHMDADAEYIRILRAMTPEQKLRATAALNDLARELKSAGLRAQHPDWTEQQVQAAVREMFLHART